MNSKDDNVADADADVTVECFFKDLRATLLRKLESCFFVVGCIAWISDPFILTKLHEKSVSIVVQHTPHANRNLRRSIPFLCDLYSQLSTKEPHKVPPTLLRERLDAFLSLDGVRMCRLPKYASGKRTKPLMHHKFLVFMDESLCPVSVWTGSFNMSINSSHSIENVVVINDRNIAMQYYQEWQRVYSISKPIPKQKQKRELELEGKRLHNNDSNKKKRSRTKSTPQNKPQIK